MKLVTINVLIVLTILGLIVAGFVSVKGLISREEIEFPAG